MMLCRTLRVIDVGTSTWRQIKGSLSRSSMRTVAIWLKLSKAALLAAGLMPPVWQPRPSSSRAGDRRAGLPDDARSPRAAGDRVKAGAPAGAVRAAADLVLLPDPGLVGKPDLYRGRIDLLVARELVHNCGEAFLKASMAPSAWA